MLLPVSSIVPYCVKCVVVVISQACHVNGSRCPGLAQDGSVQIVREAAERLVYDVFVIAVYILAKFVYQAL